MNKADFNKIWAHFHPSLIPVGNRVKHSEEHNVTRFHVLLGSAEVAKDFGEIGEMLAKYDALATKILTKTDPCWMIVSEWSDPTGHPDHIKANDDIPTEDHDVSARCERHQNLWQARIRKTCDDFNLSLVSEFYDAGDECIYKIHANAVAWDAPRFRKVLLNIYQERIRDLMWLNPKTGAIFAPYHAGVDVLMPDRDTLISLVGEFGDLLPTNGCGFLRTQT